MRLLPVLLAAGASSRFAADSSVPGRAKLAAQDSHGTPLLRLSWQALEQMRAQASQKYPTLELLPLLTILGAHKEQLQALLPPHAKCYFNPLWQQGMGHSIALAGGGGAPAPGRPPPMPCYWRWPIRWR
ncbi:glycosyltransferase family protein [Shewanella indica]|uniref:NTP transferase domain-containing protein n=1 Tax=Shewanella indica TaxID=768528 RepID=UPI0022790B49|nr:NTP transferase domain-containing protein [Shewanella indica]